ncbi:E3 ubiquitin-protein ligase RNF4-like isoform X1 [Iris pallida]|uniref:E3 ubiquitin-protein ligase RNF4-like isoform X1 n=1 Tax=Iris pallida TaxID=29817 RepID=A0AAX6HJI5_IRIPA|nr:E3 ubiquitin-protein ligase RNF4-like isoform X1 [Iris pallida]
MVLNLDLNFPPTVLAEGDLVPSSSNIDWGASLEAPNSEIFGSTIIDLEATDDDVELLFSSPAWLKGRNSSRRNQLYQVVEVPPMQSGYTVEDPVTTLSLNSLNYHERILMRSEVIDCELYISSEGSYAAKESQMVSTPHPAPPLPPPKEPAFNCPVCMNILTYPCSTVCGHIFCQHCIVDCIKKLKKCPTCRRRLTLKNFHRVFLPAAETE